MHTDALSNSKCLAMCYGIEKCLFSNTQEFLHGTQISGNIIMTAMRLPVFFYVMVKTTYLYL